MFDQQRYEADFRFSMVRLRENAESVAFYGGEAREFGRLRAAASRRVVANWWGIIRRRKKLTWFTTGYDQLAIDLSVPRRGAAIFRQDDPARRADADDLGLWPGAGLAVVHHHQLHRDRRIPGGGRSGSPAFSGRIDGIAADQQGPQPIEIDRARRRGRGRRARSQPAGRRSAAARHRARGDGRDSRC